jgi:hypothetical protein
MKGCFPDSLAVIGLRHRQSVTEEKVAVTCGTDARRRRAARQSRMRGIAGGRSAVERRAANGIVGRLLAVLCGDFRFSRLNLFRILCLVAVADMIASLLETEHFRAHLRTGDGLAVLSKADDRVRKRTDREDEACKGFHDGPP